MLSVRMGDTNAGYRVVNIKKGTSDHVSIVLAEKIDDQAPSKYVVWRFDHNPGGGYKSGIYKNDRAEAQRVFESQSGHVRARWWQFWK